MRLVDANILVYAHVDTFPLHRVAREWLDDKLNGDVPLGLPWASCLAFVRLVTNPRIFARPRTVAEAWQQIEGWLDCQAAWVPTTTDRHRGILRTLLGTGGVTANVVPDAHLAALALEHGLILCSTDSDFARFSGLRWENPLR